MQELEKILEEMRQIKDGNRKENLYAKYPPNGKDQEVLNAYSQGYEDGTDNLYNAVVHIIRKYMENDHTARKGVIIMTENEVIKIFENEVIILDCWIEHCKDIIADCETEDDEFDDDKERAELSLKDYTERKEAFDVAISALKEIQLYKDNKLCLVPEDVYSRQCSELDAYKEIGTVEECREAVEKQKPKKPHRNYKKFSGLWCKCGWYLGQKQCLDIKYCPNCGQKIDFGE